MKKLLLAVLVAALLLLAFSGTANAKTPTLKSLAKTVAALQKKVTKQAQTITTLKSDLAAAKQTIAGQGSTLGSLSSKLTADEATIAAQGTTLTNAAPLLAIAPYVSLNAAAMNGVMAPNIVFSGVNLHLIDGSGYTSPTGGPTGLGNLIVGYNERVGSEPRTGSHNVVLGLGNGFSACAGLVAGFQNTVSANWASVTGGVANRATGNCANVSSGYNNTASGYYSSVSGGNNNTASGTSASIGGGGEQYGVGFTVSTAGGWGAGNPINSGVPKYSAP
jgi:uncharacterized coiled-coil protein SlyX